VVVIETPDAVDMQSDPGGLGETLKAVRDHLAAELTEELALETQLDDSVGAVGEVNDGAGKGFVERSIGISVASETDRGTEGLGEGVSESETNIFRRVVVID
jgi:hypothetical protein